MFRFSTQLFLFQISAVLFYLYELGKLDYTSVTTKIATFKFICATVLK